MITAEVFGVHGPGKVCIERRVLLDPDAKRRGVLEYVDAVVTRDFVKCAKFGCDPGIATHNLRTLQRLTGLS